MGTLEYKHILYHRLSPDDTLHSLAIKYYGVSSEYHKIVSANSLREPFISDDPLAQYGQLRAKTELASDTVIGQDSIELIDISTIVVGSRIYMENRGEDFQTLIVSDYNTSTKVITFTTTFQYIFERPTSLIIGADVFVFLPPEELVGRVLQSGENIRIPVLTAPPRGISDIRDDTGDVQAYGTDLELDSNGNLILSDGDLEDVSGKDNMMMALRHWVLTELGELKYHMDYGLDLNVGRKLFLDNITLSKSLVRNTLLRDSRVADVSVVFTEIENDSVIFDVMVYLINRGDPLKFSVGV